MPKRMHNLNLNLSPDLEAQLQWEGNEILEQDEEFCSSYRSIRDRFTSGTVPKHTFESVVRWLVSNCFRRANIPLGLARSYQALVTLGV
jgi:hypothetical protein